MMRWIATGLMMAATLACNTKSEAPAKAEPKPAANTMEQKVEAAPEIEVPTSVDFEAEAEAEITPENYGTELDAIEKALETEM